MISDAKVGVILPCLNERGNIVPLIRRLMTALPAPREIIVIDDDSPDGTADVVRREFAGCDEVLLVVRTDERGLVSALRRGMERSTGDILAWMDCDMSMPPEKLAELVESVRGGRCDAAIGSRYVEGGRDRRLHRWSGVIAAQVLLSGALSHFTSLILRHRFRDWTSGFIAVKRDALPAAHLQGEHGEYFIRLVHSLLSAKRRIVEMPYEFAPRNYGESKTATSIWGLLRRGVKYIHVVMALGCIPRPDSTWEKSW